MLMRTGHVNCGSKRRLLAGRRRTTTAEPSSAQPSAPYLLHWWSIGRRKAVCRYHGNQW
jgi:hypothetical protein